MTETYYDRRLRERAEAREVEEKKRARAEHYRAQQLPQIWAAQQAQTQAWEQWFRACFRRELFGEPCGVEGLYAAIGHNLAVVKREAYEKARAEYAPKIEALQTENDELKDRVTKLEQMRTALEALELRIMAHIERRISEHLERTVGRKETEVTGGAQVAEEQIVRAVEKVLAPKLLEIEQRLKLYVDQCFDKHAAQIAARKDADLEATARHVGERIEEPLNQFVLNQVRDAVEKALATQLPAIEQRLKAVPQAEQQANNQRWAAIDQRIRRLEDMDGHLGPSALHETQCAIESKFASKLEQFEQRLKGVPGKLPVAKIWRPETVVYQCEFVSHDGALWQASKDTAQPPGGSDWVCVARAGRDAITPTVRGTYSVDENYQQLDIVAMDGGAFIARKDHPGVCPGPDWQMITQRGKPGRQGAAGPRGARGDKGERGEDGATTVSWQVDRVNYRVSPLMSNGKVGPMLVLRGLYEQFIIDVGNSV